MFDTSTQCCEKIQSSEENGNKECFVEEDYTSCVEGPAGGNDKCESTRLWHVSKSQAETWYVSWVCLLRLWLFCTSLCIWIYLYHVVMPAISSSLTLSSLTKTSTSHQYSTNDDDFPSAWESDFYLGKTVSSISTFGNVLLHGIFSQLTHSHTPPHFLGMLDL